MKLTEAYKKRIQFLAGIKESLASDLIKKVNYVSYEDFIKQKNKGF